jgi:DNA-binding beta-propeller fold protein YncE
MGTGDGAAAGNGGAVRSHKTIQIPQGVRSLAASRDGIRVYVGDEHGDVTHLHCLNVVDAPTASVAATSPVEFALHDITVAPAGEHLFALVGDGWINKITISTGHTAGTGFHAGIDPSGPMRLTATPDGTRLYIACEWDDLIWVHDHAGVDPIALVIAEHPIRATPSPDGQRLYVTERTDERSGPPTKISILGIGDLRFDRGGEQDLKQSVPVLDTISADSGVNEIAVSPDGTRLFASTDPYSDVVSVISAESHEIVDQIEVAAGPIRSIALSPDGTTLYATSPESDTLTIVTL